MRVPAVLLVTFLLAGPASAQTVLAVTYFDAHSVRPELEPLGRGVADMLITDLQQGRGVRVVERNRLNEILGELALQRSQYIDEATAQQLGRGLGATAVVAGSMTMALEGMRIDARVVDVETGEVLLAVQATGSEEAFFELERQLAGQILDGLAIEHDPAALATREDLTLDQALAGARRIDEADLAYVERLAALRVYKSKRLIRRATTFTTYSSSSDGSSSSSTTMTWVVEDGGGTPLGPYQFAERMGDSAVMAQLEREQRQGTAGTLVLLGSSLTCVGVGLPMMVVGIRAQVEDYDYGGDGPDPADPRAVIGTITMATGFGMLAFFHWPIAIAQQRAAWVANFYTPEQADELIREYNDRVGEELGLDREDILQMDLHSRRPSITIQPVFSLGWTGVTGRF